MRDGEVVETKYVRMGASTDSLALEEALGQRVGEWEGLEIECFLGSGMITSNIGRVPLPHRPGPFDPRTLTLDPLYFPHIHPAPFYLVPGVKFVRDRLRDSDSIKGEETEVYGYLRAEDMDKTLFFIHYGSHNKALLVERGVITDSVTTMGGELLAAIVNHTILKTSVAAFDTFEMEESYVKLGYETCRDLGLPRSMFLGRAGDILFHLGKNEILSFLYGMLVHEDVEAFDKFFQRETEGLVVYGREQFARALSLCLKEFHPAAPAITSVPYAESELLSARGLYYIYHHCKKGGDAT